MRFMIIRKADRHRGPRPDPFTESKELIAEFSRIEVASKEQAIQWVKR